MKQISKFQKIIAQQPIELPTNPYLDVFKTFGRDELISLFINVIATAMVSRVVTNSLVLSLTGPVIEKIGFFLAYFQEAWKIYHTTEKEKRADLGFYIKKAIKQGAGSLAKDIAFHDPTYTLLMYSGLVFYPQTPAWMLSTLAFFIAVGLVAVGEVTINEIRYLLYIKHLRKIGFKMESYLESRFIVDVKNPGEILSDMAKKFNLHVSENVSYKDRYFETSLTGFNSRTPKLRLRQRTVKKGWQQAVQILYTHVSEVALSKPAQFNYYPARKDKLYFSLDQKMPWKIDDIVNPSVRKMVKKVVKEEFHEVYFGRSVVRDPKTILVSIDKVRSSENAGFTAVEIKSHLDKVSRTRLIEAMRYLMLNYPVVQTTHTKSFLASMNS